MPSSSSSPPKSKKLKGTIAAVEESKEKATESNYLKQKSPNEVMSEKRTENPSFRSGDVRTEKEILKFYPSKSNKIYTCNFCKKGFSTSQALGGHQNAHKQEREWDKKRKEMEADFPGLAFLNPYLDKPHLLLSGYSQDALSNDNHLGIIVDPFKYIGNNKMYPSFNSGVTRGITDMNMTVVPRMPPTRFFTGDNNTHGSYNNTQPLIPRRFSPSPSPPPTQTNKFFSNLFPKKNVLKEENFISKLGKNNIVEIDDDDLEEKKSKNCDIDLSLSL